MDIRLGLLLLSIVPFAGCISISSSGESEDAAATGGGSELADSEKCRYEMTDNLIEGSERVEAAGTLRWVEVEGGFWGIEADDGTKYQLTREPCDHVREDGRRVYFEGRTRPDMGGINMWGTYFEPRLIARA